MHLESNITETSILKNKIQKVSVADSDSIAICRQVGNAKWVLLGEATHGTEEFYQSRAAITRRLIVEKGFKVVIIEADWPSAYQMNRFVRGQLGDVMPEFCLNQFNRFPLWIWRNTAMLEFLTWLKAYNDPLPYHQKVGIYGMDLYSLYPAIGKVLNYLQKVDSAAADRARGRYACFDRYVDAQAYGYRANLDLDESCAQPVLEQLVDMQQHAENYIERKASSIDEYFFAEQNAILVKDAERYYRALFQSDAISWNIRDKHMSDTIDNVVSYLQTFHSEVKVVVWAHNSHVGIAKASQMGEYGELSLGQLLRERYGDEVFILGYSTYHGTVMATSERGKEGDIMQLRTALPESYEAMLHNLGVDNFVINLKANREEMAFLNGRLQRAIGIIYRNASERHSHYYYADLIDQFDAILHFDKTSALMPLDFSENITSQISRSIQPSQ